MGAHSTGMAATHPTAAATVALVPRQERHQTPSPVRCLRHLDPPGMHSTLDDALRLAEARLQALVDCVPVGVTELSADGTVLAVNAELCRMVGRTAEELTGRPVAALTAPRSGGEQARDLTALVGGAVPGYRTRRRALHADGSEIPVLVTTNLVRSASGAAERILVTLVDERGDSGAEARARFAAVSRATEAVLTDPDPRQAICDAVRDVSGALSVKLFEPDGSRLLRTTAQSAVPGVVTRLVTHDLRDPGSRAVQVLTRGEMLLLDPLGPDDVADPPDARVGILVPVLGPRPTGADATEAVGPQGGRRSLGVLAVGLACLPAGPVEELVAVLQTLAGQAAVTIMRADLTARLARQAQADGLTGLTNRRAWDQQLPGLLADCRSRGVPVAVALIDLDHFKAYNDTHGHAAGDDLLRSASARWSALVRATDLLARYGGEEFGLALPGCPLEPAVALLARLRAALPDGASMSAGLTAWDGAEPVSEVVGRADRALYEAKAAGRARTEVLLAPPVAVPADHGAAAGGTAAGAGAPGVAVSGAPQAPARDAAQQDAAPGPAVATLAAPLRQAAMSLPAAAHAVGAGRRFLMVTLEQWDLQQHSDTAGLLCSELLTNAVEYGDQDQAVLLSVNAGEMLRVTVQDRGRTAPDVALVRANGNGDGGPDADLDAAVAEAGRGLTLVAALSDAWGLDHDEAGTTGWFELDLRERTA